jgi:two-component system sensor histidine kinase KdpD
VETHGRPETQALVGDLEVVPRRRLEHRGLVVEEMDLEAVLARRPQVAIVDELAHTNAPGSRNRRRYEDALDLVAAGINVICAFNVQHLESLNDLVERTTGVRVRETVPDVFLKRADLVVNIDLSGDDLVERLKSGKIYARERVAWALEHFFRGENLAVLRELALREVAESVDRRSNPLARVVPQIELGSRLLVCLRPGSPRIRGLVREASRMAGRLNTHWFALVVATPKEGPERIEAATQRHLHDAAELARELGAEVDRVMHRDPLVAIVDFARSHNVRDVVVDDASREPWWRELLGLTLPLRLVRNARSFHVHVLRGDPEEER